MKYLKFPQASAEIIIPNVGPVPFHVDGAVAVFCVEFTPNEMREILANGNRLYILGPVIPNSDRPYFIKPHTKNPFINPLTVSKNGKNHDGQADKSQGNNK